MTRRWIDKKAERQEGGLIRRRNSECGMRNDKKVEFGMRKKMNPVDFYLKDKA